MTYKEDMEFQKHLSLWDWQSSGVSARNKFRRSMAQNFPWKYPCIKGNLRYITPSSSIPEIDTQLNLNKLLNQANHQQRSCGNKSKNLTTAPRPFLVSRRILGSSSGETFLNKSRSAGCRGHSLRTCSTVSSWPHSQLWSRSSMPRVHNT